MEQVKELKETEKVINLKETMNERGSNLYKILGRNWKKFCLINWD